MSIRGKAVSRGYMVWFLRVVRLPDCPMEVQIEGHSGDLSVDRAIFDVE